MYDNYTILAIFDYTAEAQITKVKLEAEGFRIHLLDEKTIDSDPAISGAIGGVKLLVHNDHLIQAKRVYNDIRVYALDENNKPYNCPNCNSHKVLIAPLTRKNIFYMLFPFFEETKRKCTVCQTIF
ncbi:hypothetical protein SCB49_07482 [unidentified eubacterium SCB49]|nr:hypothetical protein SCB49_07482 [unidentified eubacterium SCB49]